MPKFSNAVDAIKTPPGIRTVYNPTDREKEKIRMVYRRFQDMKDSPDRQKAMEKADYHEKLWEAWRPAIQEDQWNSNHVVPIVFSSVETALSEMILQNIRPLILPRSSEDVPKARVMSSIYGFDWETSDSDLAVHDIMQDGLVLGTSIGQEYIWQEKRIIQTYKEKKNPFDLDKKEVTDYDGTCLENVKLQEFFVDETARSFLGPYGARDCIRRYVMDIDTARVMFSGPIWDPLGNMQYVRPGGDTSYYEFYKPADDMNPKKQVEVLWYWAVKPMDWLIIVINDVLVKLGPIPFTHKRLPFVRNVDTKRTHRFYGKGISEVLESMQDEATIIRRQIIDRNHLDLDKMFGVSNRLGINEEDLIARPHGMIPMDDINALKPIEYGDTPRSVEMSLKHLEDDAVMATGINPRMQALPQAGTATEAAILKESALRRINKKLWLMKKIFFVEQARLRVSNILQYYSQPKMEKIIGEADTQAYEQQVAQLKAKGLLVENETGKYRKRYRDISLQGQSFEPDVKGVLQPRKITGMSFFEATPDTFVPIHEAGYIVKFSAGPNIEISKPLARTQAIELYDRIAQAAQLFPGSYDPVKALDDVIRTSDKNPDDFKPDQSVQDEDALRLQMQVQLASQENKMMQNGTEVPATPNASPVHTRIHMELLNGDTIDPKSKAFDLIFTHATGEVIAQQARGGMPMGQDGNPASASAAGGITNRPGGVAQPSATIGDILPNRQTGFNRSMV